MPQPTHPTRCTVERPPITRSSPPSHRNTTTIGTRGGILPPHWPGGGEGQDDEIKRKGLARGSESLQRETEFRVRGEKGPWDISRPLTGRVLSSLPYSWDSSTDLELLQLLPLGLPGSALEPRAAGAMALFALPDPGLEKGLSPQGGLRCSALERWPSGGAPSLWCTETALPPGPPTPPLPCPAKAFFRQSHSSDH